ncbi:hypothetical protein [Leucobacter aridicollis]|uniref:hypothetical protein n=1 Tax=Leucobacter aridicollis TaxID=283878 RepID=UPI0021027955|nr:hypothetical protein [Leucobacter aridicollis]UTX52001.1 hypothetical protein KI794_09465 [Leucobacter aridicollis]
MEIQAAVLRVRETLAPHLSDFSLEVLDVAMMDNVWYVAHAMCLEPAGYHNIEFDDTLTVGD